MVLVPYSLLAGGGLGLYLLYRKKVREEARDAAAEVPPLTAAARP